LEPGSYVLVCWIPSADGAPHSMPFMMWGAPSALGIQQTSTYDPGSSAWVAQAVSPTVTALGPPAKAIHGGGGVCCVIAACSPAWKSAMVLPSPSRTSEAW